MSNIFQSQISTSDAQEMKQALDELLENNGENEKLKILLKNRLSECGWREEVKLATIQYIKENGIDNLDVDTIINHVTPIAREKVPAQVKKELLQKIKTSLMREIEQNNIPM